MTEDRKVFDALIDRLKASKEDADARQTVRDEAIETINSRLRATDGAVYACLFLLERIGYGTEKYGENGFDLEIKAVKK